MRDKILAVSAATIDRMLAGTRLQIDGQRKRCKGVGAAIRRSIPVRTFADWGDPAPGFFEMDMVEHYNGPKVDGDYLHTLVLTDIASGWTECFAMVACPFGLGLARRVAQVMAHLRAQRLLDERLLELLEDAFQLPRRHWPRNQLLQQLSWNLRQRRLVRRSGLDLAWHSCSFWSCYASHTNFLTGSAGSSLVWTPPIR